MDIAVLGTGSVGRALAGGLSRLGHSVAVGTRDPAGKTWNALAPELASYSMAETRAGTLTALAGLEPGTVLDLEVDETFEHGVLLDSGSLVVGDQQVKPAELAYVEPGRTSLRLEALEASRLVVLGGPPFGEEIVMWWNFIGRSHDEIVLARDEYEAGAERFGSVEGYVGDVERIPAPTMPPVRLRPRNRRGRVGG